MKAIDANEIEIDHRYRHVTKLSYSDSCYEAFDRATGQKVLIKKFLYGDYGRTKWELDQVILQHKLQYHENVSRVIDIMPIPLAPETADDIRGFHLVVESKQGSLRAVIKASLGLPLDAETHKFVLYQILRGCAFAHENGIVHMSIEPNAVRLNSRCDVSLTGFGLLPAVEDEKEQFRKANGFVRSFVPYLAPEVLYTPPLANLSCDVWSAGAVFGEMLVGSNCWPLSGLAGESANELQFKEKYERAISEMFGLRICAKDFAEVIQSSGATFHDSLGGVLRRETHPHDSSLGDTNVHDSSFPSTEVQRRFRTALSSSEPQAVDLLKRMMVIDPKKRISAGKALEHGYLSEIHRSAMGLDEEYRYRAASDDIPRGRLFEKQARDLRGLKYILLQELTFFRDEERYVRLRESALLEWERLRMEAKSQRRSQTVVPAEGNGSPKDPASVSNVDPVKKAASDPAQEDAMARALHHLKPKFKRARVVPAAPSTENKPRTDKVQAVKKKREYLFEVARRVSGGDEVTDAKPSKPKVQAVEPKLVKPSNHAAPSVPIRRELPNQSSQSNDSFLSTVVQRDGSVLRLSGPLRSPKVWSPVFQQRPKFVAPRRMTALVRNPGQPMVRTTEYPPLLIEQEGLDNLKKENYDFNNCIYEQSEAKSINPDSGNASKGMNLDKHLRCICEELLSQCGERSSIDFVTHRGNLVRIMMSYYGSEQDRANAKWTMKISKTDNTIYLEKNSTESGFSDLAAEERYVQRLHWGKQYQALCTRKANFNEKLEYTMVVQTKLNENVILMGAEVDASTPDGNLIDVKLANALITHTDRGFFFRGKLMKMWVPSYLAGVPRLLVGFRDSVGRYVSEEVFETLKVPEQSRALLAVASCNEQCLSWEDLYTCLNFLDVVLSFIKAYAESGKEYLLTYDKGELTLKPNTSRKD